MFNKHLVYAIAIAFSVFVVANKLVAAPEKFGPNLSDDFTRAPTIVPSGTTRMACTTGTDADSGAMPQYEVIRVDCDTDAWWEAGASAVTAAANTMKIRAGIPEFYTTTSASFHFSCLSVTSDGDCRISEMK